MLIVSTGVLLSRALGLVREVIFAHVWGTGTAMAAFVFAFTIPNLLRALFGEGTFSNAFVPVFSESLERKGKVEAWDTACRVVSVLAVILTGIVLVVILLSLAIGSLLGYVPGLAHRWLSPALAERFLTHFTEFMAIAGLVSKLLPGFMPYAILICAAGALAGAMNSLRHFAVPALTPLLMNVLMIGAALMAWRWCAAAPEQGILLLIPAVLASGVLHLALHLWVFRRQGLRFRFKPSFRTPEVGRIAALMAPAVIATSAAQINIVVDRFLAVLLGSVATSALYYSQRIVYLPVGLFGVASSVVALPSMARSFARGDHQDMLDNMRYSLRQVLFMCLPMVAMFGVLGHEILRLCFERGAFSVESTEATYSALVWYLPGIPFFACVKTVASAFFARQDTRTPVRIVYGCLALNLGLNLILMWPLRQGGLALSTSIASAVNLILLFHFLRRQTGQSGMQGVWRPLLKLLIATGIATVCAWLTLQLVRQHVGGTRLHVRLLEVFVPLTVGYAAYALAALALRCEELRDTIRGVAGKLASKLFGRRPGKP